MPLIEQNGIYLDGVQNYQEILKNNETRPRRSGVGLSGLFSWRASQTEQLNNHQLHLRSVGFLPEFLIASWPQNEESFARVVVGRAAETLLNHTKNMNYLG